jgi:hypothetical protein
MLDAIETKLLDAMEAWRPDNGYLTAGDEAILLVIRAYPAASPVQPPDGSANTVCVGRTDRSRYAQHWPMERGSSRRPP